LLTASDVPHGSHAGETKGQERGSHKMASVDWNWTNPQMDRPVLEWSVSVRTGKVLKNWAGEWKGGEFRKGCNL
jgi:hypothetical protein